MARTRTWCPNAVDAFGRDVLSPLCPRAHCARFSQHRSSPFGSDCDPWHPLAKAGWAGSEKPRVRRHGPARGLPWAAPYLPTPGDVVLLFYQPGETPHRVEVVSRAKPLPSAEHYPPRITSGALYIPGALRARAQNHVPLRLRPGGPVLSPHSVGFGAARVIRGQMILAYLLDQLLVPRNVLIFYVKTCASDDACAGLRGEQRSVQVRVACGRRTCTWVVEALNHPRCARCAKSRSRLRREVLGIWDAVR